MLRSMSNVALLTLNKVAILTVAILGGSISPVVWAQTDISDLPLVTRHWFLYEGGFRVPYGIFGESRASWGQSKITLGPDNSTFYLVGHAHQQAIGEFYMPELSKSTEVSDFNIAVNKQPFYKVLTRSATGNTQGMDTIGGMEYVNGKLLVNTYKYYDGDGTAAHTTLVVEDAADLQNSSVSGFYSYQAKAHASGWISPIPASLQTLFGGTYITGNSSGEPIISRLSVGPSAFAITPFDSSWDASLASGVSMNTLLDFSLNHPLGDFEGKGESYLANDDHTNKLWTHLSSAAYGFIMPGTRTYVTIGLTGGHNSGVGYKIEQDSGNVCGGFCAYSTSDYYNYVWLWDLNDLIAVKNGEKLPHEVVPYESGEIEVPIHLDRFKGISGGAFDPQNNILYLTLRNADITQSPDEPKPLIIAYRLKAPPNPPVWEN